MAVEDRAAQARHHHRFGLLIGGFGGELGALHPLQPEGAADDDEETEEEPGEEQPDPPLDDSHRAA